jgi:peptide/nickel transport system permease protein
MAAVPPLAPPVAPDVRAGRQDLRLGTVLAAAGVVLAVGAGLLAPGDPAALGPAGQALRPPGADHPLGTDPLGRDVLARLLHGGRASLLVGWGSAVLAVGLGTLVGLAAGLGPRRLQRALTALIDLFLALPAIYLVLLLVAVSRPSLWLVVAVLGLVGWMDVARLVRVEALALRDREFVAAARGLGLGPVAVAWRHVLPNLLPTVLVAAALRVGQAILVESFLSYLGLGPQEPLVTWGGMIAQGRAHLLEAWWLTAFPGLAIALTVLAYNLLADGLRAALAADRPAAAADDRETGDG